MQRDEAIGQQPHAQGGVSRGRRGAGKGDEVRFLLGGELGRGAAVGPARQGHVKAVGGETLAHPGHGARR